MIHKIIDNKGFAKFVFDNSPKNYSDVINSGIDCGKFAEKEQIEIEQFFKNKQGIYTIDFDFIGDY